MCCCWFFVFVLIFNQVNSKPVASRMTPRSLPPPTLAAARLASFFYFCCALNISKVSETLASKSLPQKVAMFYVIEKQQVLSTCSRCVNKQRQLRCRRKIDVLRRWHGSASSAIQVFGNAAVPFLHRLCL